MRKVPKSTNYRGMLATGIKAALVLEGLFLVGTYALWSRMNSSRAYYWMGETLGNLPTRRLDYEAWGISTDK